MALTHPDNPTMSNPDISNQPLTARLTEEARGELTQRAGCASSTWRAEAFTTYSQIGEELERIRARRTTQTTQPAPAAQVAAKVRQGKKRRRAGKKDRQAGKEGRQAMQGDARGNAESRQVRTECQPAGTQEPTGLVGSERDRAIDVAQRALDDALLAIAPREREGIRIPLKLFYSGARIEHAWRAIHRARAALYLLYPNYELLAQAEYLPALVGALPESSSLLKSLTSILTKLKAEPPNVTLTVRAELRGVYEQAASASEALQREARILRNALLTASLALLTAVILLGVLHALNTEVISVCANKKNSSVAFCPMGHGAERFDVFAVELAGMLGGLLSVVIPIATGERINTPYRVFNQQLVLKTFAGAATALAGVMLVVSGLIPGFVIEGDSVILGYAVFFGIAQQAVTGAVDRRANTLAAKTPDLKSV